MRVADIESLTIKLASLEDILSWSHGEVTKPETINYRTQRAEKDGLFCEKIFGPEKDYECYCGKYKRVRYKGIICDKCGVEVTKSQVRRERMGHIKLAAPVSHIWYLRGVPSRIGMVLDLTMQQVEKVIYFAAYIITKVDEEAKKRVLEEIEKEYKLKAKTKNKKELQRLKEARTKAREEVLSIRPQRVLSEYDYYHLSTKYGEVFEAGTGAETLRKITESIDLKKVIEVLRKELESSLGEQKRKILRRLKLFEAMERVKLRPEWMFLTALPVLPPDLRPMVQLDGGRYASSDLNDLYRRVINRNNRLKYLLEIKAPDVIVRNEKRMLQEAVDALIDNGMRKGQTTTATTGGRRLLKSLADMLKGKQGRFRQNLLGKRVDYSGRSVIVVGPELKLSQVGIPKKMALELFKPFVIRKIIERELAYNVRMASRIIEQETDDVWAILEEEVKGKFLLLNRAPTLHRLSIQAFQPVLIEGKAIRIHPMVCKAYNADFDGDQMAVYLPLSEEAQREARDLMFSAKNLLLPSKGTPITVPSQDIVLGCYYLTKIKEDENKREELKIFSDFNEAILAFESGFVNLEEKIKVLVSKGDKTGQKTEFLETSTGRILFNQSLPEGFPFLNEEMNSKKLERLVSEIIEKYGIEKAAEILDKIKELGFEAATLSGISWGKDDLIVPGGKEELIKKAEKEVEAIEDYYKKGLLSKEEKSLQVIEVWQRTKNEIEKLVPQSLPKDGTVFSIIDSGARGSWVQPVQMAGMKGLVINPIGQIIELPVKSSFKEGFDVLEYFISTHGARKGTADTALRTSMAGYLTRRLIDVSHDVIITEEDCRTKQAIEISKKESEAIGQDFSGKIVGRVAAEDIKDGKTILVKKGEIINRQTAKEIEKNPEIETVAVRSVLKCESLKGVCQKCYGWDLAQNKLIKIGEAVGIIAAQAIGEPGTQLTLRTFHTGGVAGSGDITQGLPRVEELFEVQPPLNKAIIAERPGKIEEIKEQGIYKIIKIKTEKEPKSIRTSGLAKKPRPKTKKQSKSEIIEIEIPSDRALWVKEEDIVKKGQQLCEGHLDLKELFKISGIDETMFYIIREIQKIYVSQGAVINDKHIEVIVRQMFSRVRIQDPGDSLFTTGEIVEEKVFLQENSRLKKENKKLVSAQYLILGISKVALTCDSFLSAASFQETSRVLIRASLEGKIDKLKGLKENVIIGKLIPIGTSFRLQE